MKKEFYSNGKLLLTGEYVVLDGAKALALPTKMGQYLTIESIQGTEELLWESKDADGSIWYSNAIPIKNITDRNSLYTHDEITETLLKILHEAHAENPTVFRSGFGYKVTTTLTFPKNWGLGTSSTLINNIAQWFEVNAFELLQKSFGGSGYDIACAQTNAPLVYQLQNGLPVFETVDFNPAFKDQLFFVYLNQKQNSRKAIEAYRNNILTEGVIKQISEITAQILKAQHLNEFMHLLDLHEQIIAEVLQIETIKQILFADFKGSIKSLGAWGGDFVLAVANDKNPIDYFKEKGYEVVIPYNEMIR